MTLDELRIGQSGLITVVKGEGALRQHFLDMGLIPGAEVTFIKTAPLGDPMEFVIHGYSLTLRKAEASQIDVDPSESSLGSENEKTDKRKKETEHPGLGEGGRYHGKGDGEPLPDDTVLTFALVGNQNCGKTTLFNQLTGSNQHVGNFPGVTVERKDGVIRGHSNTRVTDLPGIYSMSPYTSEEIVSRNFVLNNKPNAIINIIDATNIERNLYLTMQLLEMGMPMVVALNMMDEIRNNHGHIDVNLMEEMLGVPVIPISASKNEGVDELIRHCIHIAHFQERPPKQDFCDENDHGGAVHRCIHAVIHLIEDHAKRAGIPVRFAASKVIENDHLVLEQLDLDSNEKEMLEHITSQMETERGLDRSAAIADMRYAYINRICKQAVSKPRETIEHMRSARIDRVLTGRFSAIPMFILIMGAVFFLTFNVIGKILQDILDAGVEALSVRTDALLSTLSVNPTIHSLIIDGIFTGVGSVIGFLPVIVTLFFFLSLLEDSGYIARVAFFMDKILRKIGLSGRSIVPLLIGFGCSVPAVMSTRTLPSDRDRKMTILLTPFMSCSAKVPIFAFFINAFFKGRGGLIMLGLYLLSILIGIIVALFYGNTIFRGDAVPFVMELPNYRLPGIKNTGQLLWEKAKDFLSRAFTIILLASIIIWFLKSFDMHLNLVSDSEASILASIAGFMAPALAPVGLGDWRICTALIGGFMAKESVVSTLQVLFGSSAPVTSIMSTGSALSLLVFSLLYTPCVAAVATIRREMGRRWAIGVVIWQCMIAWAAAFIVHRITLLF
ncbi:MAG: ferrous iron transport protein B [Lachnospiraceae bacterium]|nr:ferrous iron transport protein B [Lachnospiraceae bacterium]